eukprot:gene27600-34345_t
MGSELCLREADSSASVVMSQRFGTVGKAVHHVEIKPPPTVLPPVETSLVPLILTPADPRFYISKIILEAMNTCDIDILSACFRKYCTNDVMCSQIYVGDLEHNPLGPNSRVFVGLEVLVAIYGMWLKVSPDNVYLFTGHSANYDRATACAVSTTTYSWTFTKVLELDPVISDEEVQLQQSLMTKLLTRNDQETLQTVEESLEAAAQYRGEEESRENSDSGLHTHITTTSSGGSFVNPEIDSFLDSMPLMADEDCLYFDHIDHEEHVSSGR